MVCEANGEGCPSPLPPVPLPPPSTTSSAPVLCNKGGLYRELRDVTSFFAEPLGSARYSEHCLHNTNLFPPLQE